MKKYLLSILVLSSFTSAAFAQTDTCCLWKNYTRTRNQKFDTVTIEVKFLGVIENEHHHPYPKSDKNNLFYQELEKKYKGLPLSLEFEMEECDCGLYYPFIYKPKYAYTLFHRKNRQHLYEDWVKGQRLVLTIVRYNRYFDDGKQLIILITDIKPVGKILPSPQEE